MAALAAELARDIGVVLPPDLQLWTEPGGVDPESRRASTDSTARRSSLPHHRAPWVLVEAMEAALSPGERQRGAHYTPALVAERVARAALPDGSQGGPVVDPACGSGALLLASADQLAATGFAPHRIARDLLFGADIDPLAVAVAEAAIALWSGGVAPAPGHLVVGDSLGSGRSLWPAAPAAGFAAVVGNPPFQGQLARATSRSPVAGTLVQDRLGAAAAGPYVDTAALFLLAGLDLAAHGARVAMVQPQSTAAARDAGPVRAELARRSRLVELWAPPDRLFAARVHVCVAVLEVGEGDGRSDWVTEVASARGTPRVDLTAARPTCHAPELLAARARVLASFRDHYYGLVAHVTDAGDGGFGTLDRPGAAGARGAEVDPTPPPEPSAGPGGALHPLVTAGSVGIGHCDWGVRPVRFAKQRWDRPVVDVAAVRASSRRLDRWLSVVLAPKLVVASQTKVLEAAADHGGRWVPSTPTISVVPADADDLALLLAAVCSPPASAWVAHRAAGTALSADAVRVTRGLLEALPLPVNGRAWAVAAAALAAGDLPAYTDAATAMYGLAPTTAREVVTWWLPRARSAWLPEGSLR